MTLIINGKETQLVGVSNLEDVLKTLNYSGNFFAVALNMTCIPHTLYHSTSVQEKDAIEILSPMQGG